MTRLLALLALAAVVVYLATRREEYATAPLWRDEDDAIQYDPRLWELARR